MKPSPEVHEYHPFEYVPMSDDEEVKEVNISDIKDHEDLIEEVNEYVYDSRDEMPEMQGKIKVKQNLQLEGDHSISMSKETDENNRSEAHPAEVSQEYGTSQFAKSESVAKTNSDKEYKFEQYISHDEQSLHKKEEFKSTTKIVQIDCQSLDPLETTKSKDELVDSIRREIEDTGKEPDTRSRFYRVGKLLGRGAFGKVSLGMHKITNQLVAIKSINKEFLEEERSRRKVAKEVTDAIARNYRIEPDKVTITFIDMPNHNIAKAGKLLID